MTPHHLHATTAAWSLHTARQHLAQHARVADAQQRYDEVAAEPSTPACPGDPHCRAGHRCPQHRTTPAPAGETGGQP